MPIDKLPDVLGRKIIAQSQLFEIEQMRLQFRNGENRTYERLVSRSNGAVTIVPMLDDETVLLVREYGAGVHEYYLSLPAGAIDAGESELEAANRELQEEIGFGANSWSRLFELSGSPSYTSRKMPCWLARDLYPQKQAGDEPEPLEVVPWSIHHLPELLARPDFHDAKSVAALYRVRDLLKSGAGGD